MRKIIISSLLGAIVSTTAVAAAATNATTTPPSTFEFPHGLFISGQVNNSWAHDNTLTVTNIDKTGVNANVALKDNMGVGAGLGLGYAFNRYFALETGYRYLSHLTAVAHTTNTTPQLTASDQASMSVADILMRLTIPMDRFFVYAKGGAAYAMLKNRNNLTVAAGGTSMTFNGALPNISENVWRPEAGLGLGYALSEHVTAEVSYSRIFGLGQLLGSKYIPDVSTLGLGVSYYF